MPAVTIDRLDIGIYIQYARRMQLIEQVQQQYNLKEAGSVPAQALILDFYPKLSELDILLGVGTTIAPWAYFFAPINYKAVRFSPFAFRRVLPSLEEEEEIQEEVLSSFTCDDPEEETERKVILSCIHRIRELNDLMKYISGRVGQFLQG